MVKSKIQIFRFSPSQFSSTDIEPNITYVQDIIKLKVKLNQFILYFKAAFPSSMFAHCPWNLSNKDFIYLFFWLSFVFVFYSFVFFFNFSIYFYSLEANYFTIL